MTLGKVLLHFTSRCGSYFLYMHIYICMYVRYSRVYRSANSMLIHINIHTYPFRHAIPVMCIFFFFLMVLFLSIFFLSAPPIFSTTKSPVSASSASSSSSNASIIVPIVVILGALVVIVIIVLVARHYNKSQGSYTMQQGETHTDMLAPVTFDDPAEFDDEPYGSNKRGLAFEPIDKV